MSASRTSEASTPVWQVSAVWILVLVPLAWGFIQTLLKAVQLFV